MKAKRLWETARMGSTFRDPQCENEAERVCARLRLSGWRKPRRVGPRNAHERVWRGLQEFAEKARTMAHEHRWFRGMPAESRQLRGSTERQAGRVGDSDPKDQLRMGRERARDVPRYRGASR